MFGPINIRSLGGASYYVKLIDDASRKVWVYPMKRKDDVFEIFQKNYVVVEERLKNYWSASEQKMVENIAPMHSRITVESLE